MSTATLITGLDLLLQFIDRSAAAAAIIRRARAEDRPPTSAELASIKDEGKLLLDDLDAAIEKAKAEGR